MVLLASGTMAQPAKVDVCHLPPDNPANAQTINVSERAIASHLEHGDWLGECDSCPLCRKTGESDECVIFDVEILSLTCIDDGSYRICIEAITQNVPPTSRDLETEVDGELFTLGDLSGLGLTARGFFGCVDLPAEEGIDRDVFISVDEEGLCCACEDDFWDDPECSVVPASLRATTLEQEWEGWRWQQ